MKPMINFKINIVNKPRKERKEKIVLKGVIGLCKEKNGEFRFFIEVTQDDIREYKFTPQSLDCKDRVKVFYKYFKKDKRNVLYIRDHVTAHINPCDSVYQTLADNWVVKGDIVNVKGEKMFDLKQLIGRYNPNITYRDEDYPDDRF